jgi:putative alpha-1,2-mannosidase
MSAWYVFATLGIYPVNPMGATYVAGLPLASLATLDLADGRVLDIERRPTGGVVLNRRALPRMDIPHRDLARGGLLQIGPD